MTVRRSVLALAALALVAGCSSGGTFTGGGGTPTLSPRPSPTSPAPSATPSATPRVTAADSLARFFDAARAADARLHVAAQKINGGIRATSAVFDTATVAAVRGLNPALVGAAIPPGLPAPLLRAVLLVDNDLEGRAAAMKRVWFASGPIVLNTFEGKDLLRCLRGGSAIAARYPADLAAALALARGLPAVARTSPTSLAAAELAVRLTAIRLNHNGCDSCGGVVHPQLALMTWTTRPSTNWGTPSTGFTRFGTILGIPFRARYTSAAWHVELLAC